MYDKKPSVLIVDDEPLARSRLKSLCKRLELIGYINLAEGGHQALQMIGRFQPDILLLDVDMPDLSGLEVAEYCENLTQGPEIVFTTAHDKYAIRAFRLEATDYLLKPVKETLLCESIERAIANLARRRHDGDPINNLRLWVQDGRGALQLAVSDIEWIAAERDYMRLHLRDRSYLLHQSMRALEEQLPNRLFTRVHRSTIVRRDCIQEVRRKGRKRFVVLRDGNTLTVGPAYANNLFGTAQAGGVGGSETVTE